MNKYRNTKTSVDGIVFDSKAEAKRYGELKLLEKAGEITLLELQYPFDLVTYHEDTGDHHVIGRYVADFDYLQKQKDGNYIRVTEDVKGVRTALYRWKKKHFEAQYGWPITEYPPKKRKSGKRLGAV